MGAFKADAAYIRYQDLVVNIIDSNEAGVPTGGDQTIQVGGSAQFPGTNV